MRFTKMHGAGNDYIYVNCFEETVHNPAALAVAMSRPHFGVGSDGLVLIDRSPSADFRMRIFNADGSESEMCGNATRCIAKYVYERGLTNKEIITLQTGSGIKTLKLKVLNGKVISVQTDMGMPVLTPSQIPVFLPGEIILNYPLETGGLTWRINCVSMGNPHCVIFVNDPDDVDLPMLGSLLEHHHIFPNRANIEFVSVRTRDHIDMRVWERGAGETLACGTGACAVLVASVLAGRANRDAAIRLPGGEVYVSWSPEDNHVYLEGGAEFVFDGEWPEEY